MAGPRQISDPKFKQFSEAGSIVDTGLATAIEGVAKGAVIGVTGAQTGLLREEVAAERRKFLELLAQGVDPNESELGTPSDLSGDDLLDLNIENILTNTAAQENVTVNVREVMAMDSDIQQVKRAVEQGIAPSRALEINVEKITRRFIDRFPGLASEFQRVAKTALGTDNNLLSATMRTIQDFERATKANLSDAETVKKAAAENGFLQAVHGPTPEIQGQAVAQFLAWSQREAVLKLAVQEEQIAIAMGETTRAERAFERHFAEIASMTSLEVAGTLMNALPLGMQSAGIGGIDAAIKSMGKGELQQMIFELEQQKAAQIFRAQSALANAGSANEGTRARAGQLVDMITSLYDNLITDVTGQRLSDLTKNQLEILQNWHGIKFERIFGIDSLFYKNILQFIPVDQRLQNLEFRNLIEQGMIERVGRLYGNANIAGAGIPGTGAFADSGFDPDSSEGKGVMDVTNKSQIESFREFISEPEEGLGANFEPTRIMNGFNLEFDSMEFDTKKQLLDMLGTPQWGTYFESAQRDPQVVKAVNELTRQVVDWGAVQLNNAVEQLLRDVSTTAMTRKFGVLSTEPARIGFELITTGDLVQLERDSQGVVFIRKTNAELEKVGLRMDQENVGRVSQIVGALNSNVANTLNVYARAMGNLGTGGSRDALLNEIFQTLVPRNVDADVRNEE
jgi:hypothetical protein